MLMFARSGEGQQRLLTSTPTPSCFAGWYWYGSIKMMLCSMACRLQPRPTVWKYRLVGYYRRGVPYLVANDVILIKTLTCSILIKLLKLLLPVTEQQFFCCPWQWEYFSLAILSNKEEEDLKRLIRPCLVPTENQKVFKISRHIEPCGTYMKY